MYPGDWTIANVFAFGTPIEGTPATNADLSYGGTGLCQTGWADFIFQAMFAATAATIVSGAVAERVKLTSFMIFAALLVGITAGADQMSILGAVLAGGLAGAIVVFAVIFLDRIKIDDPVGAISVHGVCSIWGTLAVGIPFLTMEGAGAPIGAQLVGTLAISGFAFVFSFGTFFILKMIMGVRVDEQEEVEGLDVAEHGVPAYGIESAEI